MIIVCDIFGQYCQYEMSTDMINAYLQKETWRRTVLLTVQSIGVVYGRLSTAPLYVFGSMRPKDIDSDERLYEMFSFIFWTLTIVPLLKYAVIVLRADDNGEGNYI